MYLNKILEKLEIKKLKNYIICLFGLSPVIVYLTGSLNNDSLALMLSIMSIFYTNSYKTIFNKTNFWYNTK